MPNATGDARRWGLGFALFVLLLPSAAFSQSTRIEVSFDRAEMGQDETATVLVRVEGNDLPESVEWPKELPFDVLSRSESRQSSFALGGGSGIELHQTMLIEQLTVQPKKTGLLEFPPVAAVVHGKRVVSEPARIRVDPPGTQPRRRPAPAMPQGPFAQSPFSRSFGGTAPLGGASHGWEKDLRLEVELDRKEAFVGQQVTLSVWIVSPVEIAGAEPEAPSYDGFWTEDFERPQKIDFQVKTIDGVPTRVYLLDRRALFPTHAGTIELPPYKATLQVNLGSDSLFDPFPDVQKVRRSTGPVSLLVKPLPAGAPSGFESVNVGTLSLDASLSDKAGEAGQPVTVRLTARGAANVKTLSLPKLPDLPGVRRFDPTTKDEIRSSGDRLTGSRTEEIVLVPEQAGELTLPALLWPVFDPDTGRYEVLHTVPLHLNVHPGTGVPARQAAGTNSLTSGLRPVRSLGALAAAAPPSYRSPLFLFLLALPMLGYAGMVLVLALRERSFNTASERRTRSAGRMAKKRLLGARRKLTQGDREGFLAEVESALLGFAADRLRGSVSGLTRERLAAAVTEAGARPTAVKALVSLLDACDAARYGQDLKNGAALADSAESVLKDLDGSEWKKNGRAA